jgi:hypothetical protein
MNEFLSAVDSKAIANVAVIVQEGFCNLLEKFSSYFSSKAFPIF